MTRADLPAGQQAVQGMHAAQVFASNYVGLYDESTIIFLTVPSEEDLLVLVAEFHGEELATFREPDRGNELTALCAAGSRVRKKCASLGMALGA